MQVNGVVGARVRTSRKNPERLGGTMTQQALGEALADWLGRPWKKQEISSVERGERALGATELVAFAVVLDEPIWSFFVPQESESMELGEDRLVSASQLIGPDEEAPATWEGVAIATSANLLTDCAEALRLLDEVKVVVRRASKEASGLGGLTRRKRRPRTPEVDG